MTNFTASGHQLVTRQRNGKDGRSVSKVDVVYQRSTSATSVPTTWVTTAPKLPKGYYLWSATKVTYKEADGKTTTEVIGAQCIASADNLKTTVERYAQTTSRTTPPDNSSSAWQEGDTSGVQAKDGYYTWTQTKIVWQDGTITYTTPICITGDKGDDGGDGNGIQSQTSLFAISQSKSVSSYNEISGWSETFPMPTADKPYVWKCVKTVYTKTATTYSKPELIAVYSPGVNPNLLVNASFISADRMSAWQYQGGTIVGNGHSGRNYYHTIFSRRKSESENKDTLLQTLYKSWDVQRIKPSKWYTLSYWSRQGAEFMNFFSTYSDYWLEDSSKSLYLFAGHSYTLRVSGRYTPGADADNGYKGVLRIYIWKEDSSGKWPSSWSIDISDTSSVTKDLKFTPTEEGEYHIGAYMPPVARTSGKDYGSVTLNFWRLVDNTQVAASYVYPSAVDTSAGYYIDGKEYTDNNTDLHCILTPGSSTEWQRHVITFKTKSSFDNATDGENLLFRLFASPMSDQDVYLDICEPKLEEGMFATGFIDGQEDAKGLDGCILRTTEWTSGITFHNDEELTSGTRFLDIAVVTKSASSFNAYKCLKTHVSSSSNAPQAGVTTECWQPINNMAPIYTPLIMAQNALLRLAQTNQIVVTDSNDNVTGGMQGNIAKPIFWIKDPKTQASVEIGFTSNSDGSISPYIAGHNQDIEQTNSSEHAFRIDPLNGSYEFYGKNLQRFLINDDGLTYWDAYGKEMEIDSQGELTFYGQLAKFQTARFELPEGNVYLRLTYKGNANMFGYVKGTLSKSTGQVTYDLENIAAYEIQNGKIVSVGTYDKDHWAWDS